MNALLHTLNIGTLATWLSVAAFGTVGTLIPGWHSESRISKKPDTTVIQDEFTLGDVGNSELTKDTVPVTALVAANPLPAPPELPDLANPAPLPEIPELPVPAANPPESPVKSPELPITRQLAARSHSTPDPSATARGKNPLTGKVMPGKPRGSGISESSRLAAGRMPSPAYPAEARRKNQTGTVTVEFTVDTAGRVVSASAKSPSPWPLLDAAAVRTVRSWSFPVGRAMTLQRPIVFQLR